MGFIDRSILFLLVGILVFSGADKILHYEGFVNALTNYVLVPQSTAPFLSLPIIALELLAGLGLVTRRWRKKAAALTAALMVCFTVALTVNYVAGERGICGCWFTLTLAQGTTMHIVQNLLLIALACMVVFESGEASAQSLVSAGSGSPKR